MTDGSAGCSCSESGSGSSQGTSARSTSSSAGLELGAPRPVGSGLRPRPRARSDRCWSRSGAARCAPTTCPRTGRRPSRPADRSPAPDPRRRATTRSFDSSVPTIPPIRLGLSQEVVVTPSRLRASIAHPTELTHGRRQLGRRDRHLGRDSGPTATVVAIRRVPPHERRASSPRWDPTAGFLLTRGAYRHPATLPGWSHPAPSGPSTGSAAFGSSTTSGHRTPSRAAWWCSRTDSASTPAATTTSPTASAKPAWSPMRSTTAANTGPAANGSGSGRSTSTPATSTRWSRRRHRSSPGSPAPCWATAWAAASFSATGSITPASTS